MRIPVHRALRNAAKGRAEFGRIAVLCVSVIGCLSYWGGAPAFALAPPVVVAESAANIAAGSATLNAEVNAEGSETTYQFEYGTSVSYGASVPVLAGSAGAGTSVVGVQAHTQGLQPHTIYHFRVVLASAGGTVDGPDQTLTTQAGGKELALPDGRQWELVSPPAKDGARIAPMLEGGGVTQAAEDGSAITYLTSAPVEANPLGNANQTQLLSKRTTGGWSTRNLDPPHFEATIATVNTGEEYRVFSSDLSLGIVQPFSGLDGEALLSPEASEYTIYLHSNAAGGASGYLPLVTAANVPAGTKFGGLGPRVNFVDATPDLSHVLLQSPVALASPATAHGLYEWAAGHLQLINLLPGKDVAAKCPSLGVNNNFNARGAFSDDGSRVVWSAEEGTSCEDQEEIELYGSYQSHLYLRDLAKGETIELDADQGGSNTSEAAPAFQLATSEDSRVLFTDRERLTPDSTANKADLYECEIVEVAGKLTCKLTDLTVDSNAGESAAVISVLGASEDGSYVYFVAHGALAPGAAPEECATVGSGSTKCNLYVRHDGVTKFIAALSQEDAVWGKVVLGYLRNVTARVSPSGRYLAFMSDQNLTGYDNQDANSGVPDEEVYLYDAQLGRLVCASCNPTGARPVGIEVDPAHAPLAAAEGIWGANRWLAANVPAWTGVDGDTSLYQTRYLSDSGRLFFNSSDVLVPQDTNGTEDVYEYEPAGVGDCEVGSVTFSGRSDGCVDLISSGAAGEEAAFMDASVSGGDVFFMTTAQLAPQDVDHGYDVYDAHICSAASPCPAVAVPPPACTTADSCRAAPAPQPGVFGAPASATFSGSGNLASPPTTKQIATPKAKKHPKRKGKARRKGKTKQKAKRHVKRGGRRLVKRLKVESSLSARARR